NAGRFSICVPAEVAVVARKHFAAPAIHNHNAYKSAGTVVLRQDVHKLAVLKAHHCEKAVQVIGLVGGDHIRWDEIRRDLLAVLDFQSEGERVALRVKAAVVEHAKRKPIIIFILLAIENFAPGSPAEGSQYRTVRRR